MAESIRERIAALEAKLGIGRDADLLGVPQWPPAWEPGEEPPEPPADARESELRMYRQLLAMDFATAPPPPVE